MRLFVVWIVVLLSGSSEASCQVARSRDTAIEAADSGATLYRVAEGAFVIIHADAVHNYPDGSTSWPHGNTGVIVGDRGILVVDSDFFPERAAKDIRLIRHISSKPITHLVNTHWHGDHTHGNAVYRKAFPDLQIVGARANAQFISVNQVRYPRSVVADSSTVRRQLARHESERARGVDSTGRPLPDSTRTLLDRVIVEERRWLAEFATIEEAPPTVLFDSTYRIDLGGKIVELRNWGRANSPADVTVWLSQEGVLFTGDIIVHPVPYVFGAYPGPWTGVLRSIESIVVKALVPGHGPVMFDHRYTRLVRELFEVAQARMDSLVRLGKTPDAAQRALDLSDYRARFVRPGDSNAAVYWNAAIVEGLSLRTYQCLIGTMC